MKTARKILITATSPEKAEKLLNDYYYSTTFKIDGAGVTNSKGPVNGLIVEQKNGRTRIFRNL